MRILDGNSIFTKCFAQPLGDAVGTRSAMEIKQLVGIIDPVEQPRDIMLRNDQFVSHIDRGVPVVCLAAKPAPIYRPR